jgi:hypothetical protein
MAVNQTTSIFNPTEIAAMGQKVIAGSPGVPTSRGIVRCPEVQNRVAGLRPEQHFCQAFGSAGWGTSTNEPRLIIIQSTAVAADKAFADIKHSRDFPACKTGLKINVTNADTVRVIVTLTGSVGSQSITRDFVAADNGFERTDLFNMDLVGYGWVLCTLNIQTFVGAGTLHELRRWRLTALPVSAGFWMPDDD